jgi:hypothetical protein
LELNGLSIDQAPPISAPVRFFITAPLFGIIAGLLMFFSDSATLMSRFSLESIVIAHAMTIGFLGFIMLGALTQMLPVLVGAKMPNVAVVSKYSFYLLSFGLLFMVVGLLNHNPILTSLAMFGLGSGFLLMIGSMGIALKGVKNFTPTVKAISTSLVFASIIVLMGIFLLYSYVVGDISELHTIVANIHSVWAVFGFAGILIIGVAFQVLPMFYVAPKFKSFCKKRVVWLISIGLVMWLFFTLFQESWTLFAKLWIATFFWAFATTVWLKLSRRRRPISDVTVWYWRSASIFLTLGSFLWIFDEYFKHEYIVMVAILIGGGFIMSIMVGMVYKVIPFLVWFHLNGMGYMSIPTMNEMINKKLSYVQFTTFIGSLIGFVFAFYIPELLQVSALSFTLSMILLEYNIIAPILIYKKTLQTKPDFDMSAFASK